MGGFANNHEGQLLPRIIENSLTRNKTIEGGVGKSHSSIGMPVDHQQVNIQRTHSTMNLPNSYEPMSRDSMNRRMST